MSIYDVKSFKELVEGNSYVGRGIVVGKTEDNKLAMAYFIMGRSENSRNRVFVEKDNALFTEPFDVSKVEDPSLIIYAAMRDHENKIIVTNGDQTDTIYEGIKEGLGFGKALKSREFEPDAPNFTPRISAMIKRCDASYKMSILKSADAEGTACNRYIFDYTSLPGVGHFIHTYNCDGNPLPTFTGEPKRVKIASDIDTFTNEIWEALNDENKISLFTRFINLEDATEERRLINKNK
ncbi:MAG: IMP cyclohydrolase [Eubacteriales bacterium]|nr:IMP cyclohydrolase [Eubacteriales bacterium]MDY3333236.1 IMP cyclohydrolase [Gallibacter sp.]